MSLMPERLVNYMLYENGGKVLGTVDVTLPSFQALSATISGAGIAGEYDSPTPGHFGSQQMVIKFKEPTEAIRKLFTPGKKQLILKAANQSYDTASGTKNHRQLYVSVGCEFKSSETGTVAPNTEAGTNITMEVSYVLLKDDGAEILEFDKFNYIYKVNGTDYLADIKNILGL